MNSEFTIAVHSLVFLAYLPDHMASSQVIANNVATNPARIRKIMSCLRKNELIQTKEGIGGGYILKKDPNEITLGQIYRSVSCGTIKPNWCSGDPEVNCVIASNISIVMDDVFEDADQYFSMYLDQISIASILNKIKQFQ
ncbi:RrF2 family transcriptional regulator [Halalkalibacter akibai]|uniref:Rrf2 family transcriptional regulator n=1 Tax=Halalkalibacter akibai (strain ATCC 43226 / DSM 21942 / CIP 109018 / JCM 9157 / 1139) TaxID=1236973 RepID=W4QV90_HALA3|nr:Rrf2 family transcriptional regulator [Halalkalibacter akibai]GAE35533.1 Rrf2 family transcriptional regulator [Halalkalibacter akibai JCM 9157]